MLSVYELYDLHFILIAIRSNPDSSLNKDIVLSVMSVLNDRAKCDETNQFRRSLQSIDSIKRNSVYSFVFTENVYSYYPLPFLTDEKIYAVLLAAFKELLSVLREGKKERIVDLSDCLHNLPIIIVDNYYSIPNSFWKTVVKFYRAKWNNNFLQVEQSNFKKHVRV